MANILFIYENKIATVELLEMNMSEMSEYKPKINYRFLSVSDIVMNDIDWCDILFMIRPNNYFFGRIAKTAHKRGALIVFFADDDLLHLPDDIPNMPWRKRGLIYSIENSDIIASSSPYICDSYGKTFGISRIASMDTPVDPNDMYMHEDGKNEKVKIVYAAGTAHAELFNKMIFPILKQLDNEFGDRISLTFMGVHPDLRVDEYNMSIQYIPPMRLDEYRARIKDENFDIGLAPLITSQFTKCKYYNKFIEYSMFGIVGLYSDTEPYTYVVKNCENGLTVENCPQKWFEAICKVINDIELVNSCRKNAYETLRKKLDHIQIFNKFAEEIPEALEEHKEGESLLGTLLMPKVLYYFSRLEDWAYKAMFYFKCGGIKEVLIGVKRRINTIRLLKS